VPHFGLDKPFFVQFWHFLLNAAQGEFGLSLRQGAKVSRLIGERFPRNALNWPMVAAVMALVLGVPMGVYSAFAPWEHAEPGLHGDLAARRLAAHLSSSAFC
jgi:ABC-type dipeptide/oligopeptide/nickel transport system permease component